MLTWSIVPDVRYCDPIVFSSKANSSDEQENRSFYRAVTYTLTASLTRQPLAGKRRVWSGGAIVVVAAESNYCTTLTQHGQIIMGNVQAVHN